MIDLDKNPCYAALKTAAQSMQASSIAQCFIDHPQRQTEFTLTAAGLTLNYAYHLLTPAIKQQLCQLAEAAQLKAAIERLFTGGIVNYTEQASACHTALRCGHRSEVLAALEKMTHFVNGVRANRQITRVINLGVGGSHLGPAMATEALDDFVTASQSFDFISHYDPHFLRKKLASLDPKNTLCIVASKSFSTYETLANAKLVKQWFIEHLGDKSVAQHMVGVTAKPERAMDFGLSSEHIFPLWSWVGGRFSIWSCVSLALAIAVGIDHFEALLQGAHAMDEHFRHSALDCNMPVIMALLTVWYNHFFQCQSKAIIPYTQQLALFPAYLQQLVMESLGKSTNQQGQPIHYHTGSIIWGGVGTDSQHSFHQLLLQGNQFVTIDFILPLSSVTGVAREYAMANCLAQQELLAKGYVANESYRSIAGNVPSNLLQMPCLTPETLGALIALYEHSVYTQSVIWNIDAFDQWGVERGKILASEKLKNITATLREQKDYVI